LLTLFSARNTFALCQRSTAQNQQLGVRAVRCAEGGSAWPPPAPQNTLSRKRGGKYQAGAGLNPQSSHTNSWITAGHDSESSRLPWQRRHPPPRQGPGARLARQHQQHQRREAPSSTQPAYIRTNLSRAPRATLHRLPSVPAARSHSESCCCLGQGRGHEESPAELPG